MSAPSTLLPFAERQRDALIKILPPPANDASDGEPMTKAEREEIAEIRLALPNRHHFLVDLAPFGLTNQNEVFYASDRPYGLIEGTVRRAGVADSDLAW